jgi:prolyl oligopeptidase
VPYFVVHKKGLKYDGENPTVIYGYGGFNVSELPFYMGDSAWHSTWFDRGGVFVLANIRGGGEFGPDWHNAALKENRQKAYDDFVAVIEDAQTKKITSPRRTGIMGGSNGGLLVGVAMTQKPYLMRAVVSQVPLLDMLRYTELPPGASWIGEYGDPRVDVNMRSAISRYSPFQNVFEAVKYPDVLLLTSTKDDRVHPGHARKFYAKLADIGATPLLYENPSGGHAGASDLVERIYRKALELTFLHQRLTGP